MNVIQEWNKFNASFDTILSKLLSDEHGQILADTYKWLKRMIVYNVPHGKRNRGLAVVNTYRLINEENNNPVDEEELELARILGWTVEFLQAHFLVIDDIMDQSITRRGQPCWYQLDDVGLNALNDAIIIDQEVYNILKIFFSDKPYYAKLYELMHEITLWTTYGQQMDSLSNPPNGRPNLEIFTKTRLENIQKYKTAYYSYVLPVRLGLYMSSITSEAEHKNAEEILIKIGLFFQTQDDFLDCWGDPNIIGKIGTDIEEGKCCWPIVTALSLANERQSQVLKENYGNKDSDSVRRVKDIYKELNLKELYFKEETKVYTEISQMIEDLEFKSQLNRKLFQIQLDQIYKRQNDEILVKGGEIFLCYY